MWQQLHADIPDRCSIKNCLHILKKLMFSIFKLDVFKRVMKEVAC